jgi:hypothetical protein
MKRKQAFASDKDLKEIGKKRNKIEKMKKKLMRSNTDPKVIDEKIKLKEKELGLTK